MLGLALLCPLETWAGRRGGALATRVSQIATVVLLGAYLLVRVLGKASTRRW